MSVKPAAEAVRDLRTLFHVGSVHGRGDGQLLEQFRSSPGPAAEAAFAALVARHGPMVLRVCRGVLNDEHDAQDAFQATFLVLVRKAGSVRNRASVASWLYGVAHRVSSRARVEAARRRAHERRLAATVRESRLDDVEPAAGPLADLPALDEEIRRLPEKYRAAVVLCYLEGLTGEQAAEQLGWPSGTVRGRLSRARALLRTRLSRRGLELPAAAALAGDEGAGAGAPRGAPAALVPAALIDATARAALPFAGRDTAEGVASAAVAGLADRTAWSLGFARLKVSLACLGIGLAGASAAGLAVLVIPETPRPPAVAEPDRAPEPPVVPGLKAEPEPEPEPALVSVPEPAPLPEDDAPSRSSTALARPLKGIVVDGDLRDWPAGLERHAIARPLEQGRLNKNLAGEGRPPAEFRVGYDPGDQRIYLAVTVPDAIPVVNFADTWHTDAVEVFVDGRHTDRRIWLTGDWGGDLHAETMPALQYAGVPGRGAAYNDPRRANPSLVYGDVHKTTTVMAWSRTADTITYEWAVQAFDHYPDRPTRLEPGKRIGLDVAVLDQNLENASPPGTTLPVEKLPSYTTWAPWSGVFKGADAGSLGDLVIAPPR